MIKLQELSKNTVPSLLESWKGWQYGVRVNKNGDKVEIQEGKRIESPFIYAHTAWKIAELEKLVYEPGVQPHQPFRPYVRAFCEWIVTEFVERNFFLDEKAEQNFSEKLNAVILEKFADNLSLFGLAHALHLLEHKIEPLDKTKIFGRDLMSIGNAISIYTRYCQSEFWTFEKEWEVERQLEDDPDRNWEISEEVLEKYQQLSAKLPPVDDGNIIKILRKHRHEDNERWRRDQTAECSI